MKEARYFYVPHLSEVGELPNHEIGHAIRVLHLQPKDIIWLTDGKGQCYEAEVTTVSKHHCTYRCLTPIDTPRTWQGRLHVAIAPTKNMDRTEWFIEKATEIGIDSIHFILCKHSERKQIRIDRIEKIAISAMKQSHKSFLPEVHELCSFETLIKQPFEGQKFIAHCYTPEDIADHIAKPHLFEAIAPTQNALILIGPEGDFSVEEVRMAIQNGYVPVSLGDSRLRTETAALTAVHMLQLKHCTTLLSSSKEQR